MAIYSTIQQQSAINMKYKKKLKKLKKFIENLVFVSVSSAIHPPHKQYTDTNT